MSGRERRRRGRRGGDEICGRFSAIRAAKPEIRPPNARAWRAPWTSWAPGRPAGGGGRHTCQVHISRPAGARRRARARAAAPKNLAGHLATRSGRAQPQCGPHNRVGKGRQREGGFRGGADALSGARGGRERQRLKGARSPRPRPLAPLLTRRAPARRVAASGWATNARLCVIAAIVGGRLTRIDEENRLWRRFQSGGASSHLSGRRRVDQSAAGGEGILEILRAPNRQR